MSNPKKPFQNDKTIVDAEFLTSIFGGDDGYSTTVPPSPFYKGHLHDGDDNGSKWGHAPKVNLTDHVIGRLVCPQLELKSMRLSANQATPLTSSLFWTIPVPSDAYTTIPEPMFLKIFWSGNSATGTSNAAFRVDWVYLQPGQNVMPPSIINLGPTYWPINTIVSGNNPVPTTFRFKTTASPCQLYVNNSQLGDELIPLTLPSNAPGSTLGNFLLFGLEITTAPTVTLTQPMAQISIFAIEILYYSRTLGTNTTPVLLANDAGLADF